jgi:hypothetical protein
VARGQLAGGQLRLVMALGLVTVNAGGPFARLKMISGADAKTTIGYPPAQIAAGSHMASEAPPQTDEACCNAKT